MSKGKGKGWHYQPREHSLASRGISTNRKVNTPVKTISDKYIEEGKFDHFLDYDVNGNEIMIHEIISKDEGKGNVRAYLTELKEQGYIIHIGYPRESAIPFWRKMYNEGLIDDNPDELETYEESQWRMIREDDY